jgi:hypothetical protein
MGPTTPGGHGASILLPVLGHSRVGSNRKAAYRSLFFIRQSHQRLVLRTARVSTATAVSPHSDCCPLSYFRFLARKNVNAIS